MFTTATTEPIAFLLGCERSGSTWLANILDAHEGVELVMEPFAPYAKLFPGFPGRHERVTTSTPALEITVRDGLRACIPAKYPLFYRPGCDTRWKSADAALIRFAHRAGHALTRKSPMACRRWELLNLNQSEIPSDLQVRKIWPPVQFVVKELRLNLNVALMKGAFPAARYVVIVRNPAAQLTSIRRWLDQGRLRELAGALKTLPADMASSADLAPFRAWVNSGNPEDQLIGWWFLNYQMLLTDLRRLGLPFLFMRHEDLAAEPVVHTDALLSFLGLASSPSVANYVTRSSASEQKSQSPVDTFRKSADHSRATIRGADRSIVEKLQRAARELPCAEELRVYFQG